MVTYHRQKEHEQRRRGRMKTETTVWDNINSTEEGAGKSTERSLDELNKIGMKFLLEI